MFQSIIFDRKIENGLKIASNYLLFFSRFDWIESVKCQVSDESLLIKFVCCVCMSLCVLLFVLIPML